MADLPESPAESERRPAARFRRVLLKVSGEGFSGPPAGRDAAGARPAARENLHGPALEALADQVTDATGLGVEVALVVGGGNIVRGEHLSEVLRIGRTAADRMGMLATAINGLAFREVLERRGVEARVMSARALGEAADPFDRREALRHLAGKRVVILVGGTGNPFFTTDTAAALRALEVEAEVMLKGTKVDGVYSADPLSDGSARRYRCLSYREVIEGDLGVMDATAVTLCMKNSLPIIVFNIMEPGTLRRLLLGEPVGTVVGDLPRVTR